YGARSCSRERSRARFLQDLGRGRSPTYRRGRPCSCTREVAEQRRGVLNHDGAVTTNGSKDSNFSSAKNDNIGGGTVNGSAVS
ncbi:hypothetical protein A2U01_0073492, partial [Trifolium medium]|nr:hypothetical protein [Trifolium medium]